MEVFLGMVAIFGFNFAPRGWMFCQGQILSIAQNTALFSLLGTTYGGNGQTTFALPDLRGRVAVGQGQGPGLSAYVIGEQGGSESNTLLLNQIPAHTHAATATVTATLHADNVQGTQQNPAGKMLASGVNIYVDPDPGNDRAMAPAAIVATATVTNAPAGGSQPFPNLQPFLGVNYSIAIQGIFPSRN
jgi:microcystin-dependent protein